MLSTYTIVDDKIEVKTGYSDDIVKQCRAWAGKFDKAKGAWILPLSRLPEIQERLGEHTEDQVEVEVGEENWRGYAQIRVGWYVLAGRKARDYGATVYADLVSGTIPASGGSVKNPAVAASKDARFRLWVPRDFAIARGLTITEDPYWTAEGREENDTTDWQAQLATVPTEELLKALQSRGFPAPQLEPAADSLHPEGL